MGLGQEGEYCDSKSHTQSQDPMPLDLYVYETDRFKHSVEMHLHLESDRGRRLVEKGDSRSMIQNASNRQPLQFPR